MASSETPPVSLRQGVRLVPQHSSTVEQVLLAVGEQIGHGIILYASHMNKALMVFLNDQTCVSELIESGLTLDEEFFPISPLAVSYTRITVSSVPPFIPNEALERELKRFELPSLSFLQKNPSSPISCHATGFYPERAALFWRKDGEDLHEDVDLGEILPNHDGTFQMSADLKLSVTAEDRRRYDCVFQLSGVKDNIVTRLEVIRSNKEEPTDMTIPIIAAVILLALSVIGFMVYRKKKADHQSPVNISELSEKLKDNPAS